MPNAADDNPTPPAPEDPASEKPENSDTAEPKPTGEDESTSKDEAASVDAVEIPKRDGPPWIGPPLSRRHIDGIWLVVVMSMSAGAAIFTGWRGVIQIVMGASAALAIYYLIMMLICLISPKRQMDSFRYALTQAMLVGLLQPLATKPIETLLPAVILGVLMHLIGRTHRIRIPPAVAAIVLAWIVPFVMARVNVGQAHLFGPEYVNTVLKPDRVVTGDALDIGSEMQYDPWWRGAAGKDPDASDAMMRLSPYRQMMREQVTLLQEPDMVEYMLTTGELPRLEEMLIGCVPGRLGTTSQVLIILLGLYLMIRRLSYWPMAASVIVGAMVALLAVPIPWEDGSTRVLWRLGDLPPGISTTYLSYMLLSSPLLLLALVLAPMCAPTAPAGRWMSGLLVGIGMITLQTLLDTTQAALLSLCIVGLFIRMFDAMQGRGIRAKS